jgi:hypothetical protein
VAAERGNLDALQKVWDWATGKLTTEDIKNYLPKTMNDRPYGIGQHGVGDVITYTNYWSVLKRN